MVTHSRNASFIGNLYVQEMGLPRIILVVIASRTEAIHEQLLMGFWVPFIRYVVPRYKMVKVRLVFGAGTPISDLGSIRDSIILGQSPESYIPGILKKTIDAFAILLKEPFDFMVRTNLSSFFILENLVRRLSRFRRTKLYNGIRIPPLTRDHLVEGLSFSGQKKLSAGQLEKILTASLIPEPKDRASADEIYTI